MPSVCRRAPQLLPGGIIFALLLGACGSPAPSVAETPAPSATASASVDRDAGWVGDLEALIALRERHHPEPWHGIAREEYVAAVEAVIERVPELSDDELLVETVRLAAMPTWAGRDGHGGIYPWGEGEYGTHLYPLRLYAFADGIHVVDALPPYRELVGDRVLSIGGHPVEDVMAAVEPLVPRDNHMQVLSQGVRLIVTAEILHGLGLISDPSQPQPIGFAEAGTMDVEPVPMVAYERWAGGHFSLAVPPRADGAAWIRRIEEPNWHEFLPESGTLFIQYNMVMGRLPDAIDAIEAHRAAGDLMRVVVDLRHNGGGDNTTYGGLLRALAETDADGIAVYVIAGRQTFSAAGNFVTELLETTGATFVGEDLGTSPNQYGDSIARTLEHSGLVFRVAPVWIVKADLDDPRITIEPDIPVALTAADYFGTTDPAMEAILADA